MSRKTSSLANWDMVENIEQYRDALREMLRLTGQAAAGQAEPDHDEEFIYTSLTQDICRKCPRYRTCYGEEREKTMLALTAIHRKMAPGRLHDMRSESAAESDPGSAIRPEFRSAAGSASAAEKASESVQESAFGSKTGYDTESVYGSTDRSEILLSSFRRKCVFYSSLIEEMTWLSRLIYQNRFWRKRMEAMRRSLHTALAAQQGLLDQCVSRMEQGSELSRGKVRFLNRRLLIKGCSVKKAMERRIPADGPEVIVEVRLAGARPKQLFEEAISSLYGKKMVCSHPGLWIPAGRQRLLFTGESHFYVTFGKMHRSKNGETVCGDSFSFVSLGGGQAVCCLADGVGTGRLAYESSSRLIEAFESMLTAGISEQAAMEMLHALLSLETGDGLSTLDTASISLTSGIVSLTKAGGAATFIRHRDQVERICRQSLPLGSLEPSEIHTEKRKLYDGDRIVMMSDGMLTFENSEGQAGAMESILMDIEAMNAQTYAEEVMRRVPLPQDGGEDDRTVLVAAIWER